MAATAPRVAGVPVDVTAIRKLRRMLNAVLGELMLVAATLIRFVPPENSKTPVNARIPISILIHLRHTIDLVSDPLQP